MAEQKKSRKKLIGIVQLVLLAVAVAGAGWLVWRFVGYSQYDAVYTNLAKEHVDGEDIDFDALAAECPDLIGWIHLDDVNLDFPLVQGEDNEHYLHYDATGEFSWNGAIFLDYRNNSLTDDLHTIVYGHNMLVGGMLSPLTQYKEESFYKGGTGAFWIATPTATYHYQIFAVSIVAPDDDIYTVGYKNTDVFDAFVQQIKEESIYDTGVSASGKDRVLTISTCSRPNRLVLSAKLVSETKRSS